MSDNGNTQDGKNQTQNGQNTHGQNAPSSQPTISGVTTSAVDISSPSVSISGSTAAPQKAYKQAARQAQPAQTQPVQQPVQKPVQQPAQKQPAQQQVQPVRQAQAQPAKQPMQQPAQPKMEPTEPPQMPLPNDLQADVPTVKQSFAKHRLLYIGILAFIVAAGFLIAVGIWWYTNNYGSFDYDDSVQPGRADYRTEDDIREELNRIVEEGMFNISIASVIEFEDGTSSGIANIENSESNKYDMQVSITIDQTGDMVYMTRGLPPGTHIETIQLTQDLPAGSYSATATFRAFDTETHTEVGQSSAKITIVVKN